MMNGYQRINAALNGEWPDKRPVMLHNFMMAAKEAGISQKDYREDPEKIAKVHIQAVEKYHYDGVLIDVDTATLAGAVGVPVDFPENDPARAHGVALSTLEEVGDLQAVDLSKNEIDYSILMVEITPTPKTVATATQADKVPYLEDTTGGIDVAGINVDDDNYDNGSFIDRDYDVRFLNKISILLENLGPNDVDYTILSTTKDFDVLDTDLQTDDFTEVEKAETAIVAGSQATGSVEVTGGPSVKAEGDLTLVSAVANTFADGTVTCVTAVVDDTVTVNGLLYTAVAGVKADNTEFSIDTSDTATAADLADSITNDARVGTIGDLSATSSVGVTTITTDVLGTGGNAVTLVSSDGVTLAVSGAVFTGGVTADQVTVNGLVYIGVAGAKADNTEFSIDTSDTAAATDLADSITNDARTPITVPTIDVTATSAIGVVTVEAPLNDGAAGNAIDTVGSANITAASGTLLSGVTSTMDGIDINGVEIMSGAVPWRTSDTLTGDDIASNINAFTSTPNYTGANVAGVVTITRVGSTPDTGTVVSTTTVMTKTDVNMTGGTKGVSAVTNIERLVPQITALKVRAKEAAAGSPGKIRADIKFRH